MSELSEHMRYLAMRAKKMSAHMPEVPTPATLRELFAKKGTEINADQARTLVKAVKDHRETVGIGGRKPKTTEKPQKPEVSVQPRSQPRQKYSASYGR